MSDCPRFGKLFGACRFVARHDHVNVLTSLAKAGAGIKFGEGTLIPMVDDKIYVRDVCVRCGKTVDRKPS